MIAQRTTAPLRTFAFRDMAIWRTKLPKVKFAVLPPGNTRPNPLVADDKLFVSVFSPGAVCSLSRKNGHLIWRRELPELGGASVSLANGVLFARSQHTLYALSPDSGATLWSFCPYGTEGEWIYSSPSVHRGRVFIGDRKGYLHCLNVNTGNVVWQRRTNKAKNDDVNSTPIVVKGLVIVSTNAKSVVAYKVATGELEWRQKVDGPSMFGPLLNRGSLFVIARSVYLLNPETGSVLRRFHWKRDYVHFAESTRRHFWADLRGAWPPTGSSEIALLSRSGVHRTIRVAGHSLLFRYSNETNLIYVSHFSGVNLCNAETAKILCELKTTGRGSDCALVDVKDKTIYVLTGSGHVYALKHPRVLADEN